MDIPPIIESESEHCEGWLLRVKKQGILGHKITVPVWCELDELNEYLVLYSDNPNENNAMSLFTIPLESAKIVLKKKREKSIHKDRVEMSVLEISLKRGRKFVFLPPNPKGTAEEELLMMKWNRAALTVQKASKSARELILKWKSDPVCKKCVEGVSEDLEDESFLHDDESEISQIGFDTSDSSEIQTVSSNVSRSTPTEDFEALDLFRCTVETLSGKKKRLGNLIAPKDAPSPTVLLLLRHFGCILCRALIDWWVKAMPIVTRLGVKVVAVGIGTVEAAQNFATEMNYRGSLFLDNKREVYKNLKCRSGVKYAMSSDVMEISKDVLKAGYEPKLVANNDVLQLGGAYVISRKRGVVFEHSENYAGETLYKIGDLIRFLVYHQYFEENTFPGPLSPPSWESMYNLIPTIQVDTYGPLVSPNASLQHDYHIESGVASVADSSLSHMEDEKLKSKMKKALEVGDFEKSSQMIQRRGSLNYFFQNQKSQKKTRMSELGGWTKSVTEILSIAKLSFPVYPFLIPLNSFAVFYSQFVSNLDLSRVTEDDFWDTSIWIIDFEGDKGDKSEVKGGTKGVIVARICSTGDAKAVIFDSCGLSTLFIPKFAFDFTTEVSVALSSSSLSAIRQRSQKNMSNLISKGSMDGVSTLQRFRSNTSLKMEESNEFAEGQQGNEEGSEVERRGEKKKRRTKDSILQYIVSSCGYFKPAITEVPMSMYSTALKSLEKYEEKVLLHSNNFKIGVLYRRRGQTELQMYENEAAHIGSRFQTFLSVLGKAAIPKECQYSGGLDNSGKDMDGPRILRTKYRDVNLVFHVAPWIPLSPSDGILPRKRHIGNDTCVIVFDDVLESKGDSAAAHQPGIIHGSSFDPSSFKSHFNHVFAVVRPIVREMEEEESEGSSPSIHGNGWEQDAEVAGAEERSQYNWALNVVSKPDVPPFPPALAPCPVYTSIQLRDVLLSKLVNGERTAAEFACEFRKQRQKIRGVHLDEIIATLEKGN